MKITKEQLQKIIREELNNVINDKNKKQQKPEKK